MLATLFALFLILIALWLLAFSVGQVFLLLFPACPGEPVIHPAFPACGWRPVLLLSGIGMLLGLPLLLLGWWLV